MLDKHSFMAHVHANKHTRHIEIWNLLHRLGHAATAREIKDHLGYEDMNAVRPRISEMKDAGLLLLAGERLCPHSKEYVDLYIPYDMVEKIKGVQLKFTGV